MKASMRQSVASTAEQKPLTGLLQLERQPFNNTRDTRFFFASEGHAEAISRLEFLVQDENMGMGMLTGEIGCGKTMTRSVVHRHLNELHYAVVSIENGLLNFDDLLLEILSQVRGERVYAQDYPDRYSRLSAFKQELMRRLVDTDRHLVILLDEAQQLEPMCLECLKGLTNIASERRNFMSIILIGQPELRAMVKRIPQVDQRIGLRYHLNPLSSEGTARYLVHRLRAAGLKGKVPITHDAVKVLHRASRGVPREVNRFSKLALDLALSRDEPILTAALYKAVLKDLQQHGGYVESGSGLLSS